MRTINIRLVFPPYVDSDWSIKLAVEPNKFALLDKIKKIAEMDRHLGAEHSLYFAISNMSEWLVEVERFSLSHTIGVCTIYIQVEK